MAVTVYGVAALTFMMLMYSMERRGRRFILGFALGCVLSSVYGFLSGAWPFGVIEAIWGLVALLRFARTQRLETGTDPLTPEEADGQRVATGRLSE